MPFVGILFLKNPYTCVPYGDECKYDYEANETPINESVDDDYQLKRSKQTVDATGDEN